MTHESSGATAKQAAVAPNLETAGDLMTTAIISVAIGTSVRDVARLLLEKRISAVPVLSADRQHLLGMVSEGDLVGRNDADRAARRDWWLALLGNDQPLTEPLEALLARPVEQVMRAPVLTIEAQAPLHEIAEMFHVYDIKRLPVMRGGRIAGIVSRSDLIRAMAAMVPSPAAKGPLDGLAGMLAGMMTSESRPTALTRPARAPSPVAPAVTADAFLTLVTASQQAGRDDAVAAKGQAKLELERQVSDMLQEHVDAPAWSALLERARVAATLGSSSFELIRFPCGLCSDGGRKIDVAETDWPTTLRGEAAEVYTRWERDLRPAKFGLSAQLVDYVDGIASNVALSLTWRA
jgi:CBS domain-containing protein